MSASAGIEQQRPQAGQVSSACEVVCVCGGFGFPYGGTGTTGRIKNLGKALQVAGVKFRLLHCGPSPVAANTQRSGVFEGLPFEYTTTLRRPANAPARWLVYLRAVVGLTIRLVQLRPARHRTVICLLTLKGPETLCFGWLCRLLGLRMVQELSEWWPGEPSCSAFTKWLYRKRLWKNATGGVLVISKEVEKRAREAAVGYRPAMRIHRFPMVVDVQEFNGASRHTDRDAGTDPFFLWCGAVDGWHSAVEFLIRATGLVRAARYRPKLIILGLCSERWRAILIDYAMQHGLSADEIVLTGFVDERRREALYRSAAALLLPLPDDDRSRTRIPNKLGEYLASGTPVVTCKIGDLVDFLTNGVNAYLAEPSNEQDFAEQMISVLRDPAAARRIGAAGREACLNYLDYRVHATALAQFFGDCCGNGDDRRRPL